MRECQRLHWSKRIAHCLDATRLRRSKQRLKYRRKDMCVLMRVEVRDGNARRLQLAKLHGRFRFDLVGADLAACRQAGERNQVGSKRSTSVLQQTLHRIRW